MPDSYSAQAKKNPLIKISGFNSVNFGTIELLWCRLYLFHDLKRLADLGLN
jgi:hypothetical protein